MGGKVGIKEVKMEGINREKIGKNREYDLILENKETQITNGQGYIYIFYPDLDFFPLP